MDHGGVGGVGRFGEAQGRAQGAHGRVGGQDGGRQALGAGGAPKKWREVEPWVWQDTGSADRLAAEAAGFKDAALPGVAQLILKRTKGSD